MTNAVFPFALQWWFVFFLLGATMLPVVRLIFKTFFDRGYIFSKMLALAVLTYLTLVIGIAHLAKFSQSELFVIGGLMALVNYGWLYRKHGKGTWKLIQSYLKTTWPQIIIQEVLFLIAIWFWAHIRSFQPDIHGLEKFMDYGFMNSILRSTYFPPRDMWLTPFFINYYYFGHLTGAFLTKLSGLPSNITYNLILASVFAMSVTASYTIGANLYHFFVDKAKVLQVKRILAGLLTAGLVTLAGNLHILYAFFKPYENDTPVPLWQLPFLPFSFPNSYWYPNATRFIYHTIHEFPIYSWTVADLHGHVFDIPFVLTTLAVLLAFLSRVHNAEEQKGKKHKFSLIFGWYPQTGWYFLLIAFLLSVMYMTNAWDGLIYMLLSGLFILYVNASGLPGIQSAGLLESLQALLQKRFLLPVILSSIALFFGFLIFTFPFQIHFTPFVSGIGVLCAPKFLIDKGTLGPFLFEADHCMRSPWWQLLMLYGFFYFFIFSFFAFLTKVKNIRISDTFVLLLIILGTLLIIIPEFIYVKDIYPAHYRANTMFKLVFQSFMLLSLSSGYIIVRILSSMRARKLAVAEKIPSVIFLVVTLGLVTLVFLYPFQAVNSYYNNLKTPLGLDGTNYLKTLYPTDYDAIEWLNSHVTGQPVILEAQGDSYTDFARVSTNTGLPTVLGWTVHEWLWHNSYDVKNPPANPNVIYDVPAPRIPEVQTFYESTDMSETKRLIKKYDIQYVFLGTLERQKYTNLYEEKWDKLGKIVFHEGDTAIYKIKS